MRGMTNRWQTKVTAGGIQQQEGLWEGVRCIMLSVHSGERIVHAHIQDKLCILCENLRSQEKMFLFFLLRSLESISRVVLS